MRPELGCVTLHFLRNAGGRPHSGPVLGRDTNGEGLPGSPSGSGWCVDMPWRHVVSSRAPQHERPGLRSTPPPRLPVRSRAMLMTCGSASGWDVKGVPSRVIDFWSSSRPTLPTKPSWPIGVMNADAAWCPQRLSPAQEVHHRGRDGRGEGAAGERQARRRGDRRAQAVLFGDPAALVPQVPQDQRSVAPALSLRPVLRRLRLLGGKRRSDPEWAGDSAASEDRRLPIGSKSSAGQASSRRSFTKSRPEPFSRIAIAC